MLDNTKQTEKSHRRKSSVKVDPYESPDLYYGPITDPSNVNSRFGRLRTRSVIAPRATRRFSSSMTSMHDGVAEKGPSSDTRIHADEHGYDNDYDERFAETLLNNAIIDHSGTIEGEKRAIASAVPTQRADSPAYSDFLDLKDLKALNMSSSGNNTPVISDSDDDNEPDSLEAVSMKSHSTGSLVAESDMERSNDNSSDISQARRGGVPSSNKRMTDDPFATLKSKFKSASGFGAQPHAQTHAQTSSPSPLESDSKSQSSSSTSSLAKNNVPPPTPGYPLSTVINRNLQSPSPSSPTIRRRASADMSSSRINSRRFFISDIETTLKELLRNEDTDQNCQITIDDTGPKVLKLGTANSAGFNQYDIRGTYMLSNLLQELTIAKRFGRKQMILDEARLNENPVSRLYRLITTYFWKNLTRQVTRDSILDMAKDTKIKTEEAKFPRIYIPFSEKEQYYYYSKISEANKEFNLKVEYLPEKITDEFVKSINHKPGLLALAVRHRSNTYGDLEGYPYVVPGGRFNEQYGWDSYFETLGLLSCDILEPCVGMCENFIFEINNYGKILNANRSYYLCRSQPPFLTDMTLKIFDYILAKTNKMELDFLKRAFLAAIKEYDEVWCSPPRLDPVSKLSTFHPGGKGIPPETEASHFNAVLSPYCEKYNLTFTEFQQKYNDGLIEEPELDEYFLHDRAVRESGHDTSYRLEGICANLATVDLNCLLYKYETDISFVIKTYFNNKLEYNNRIETSEKWEKLAEIRKNLIDKYMWNEEQSLYFDYNIKIQKQSPYESVTAFYVLWAKVCSPERANTLIRNSLHKFEEFGGLVSGTEKSRGDIGVSKPSRQWDYPFAWAPHQILTWDGLKNYGREDIARRLSYRWLYLMTLSFVDFNGIVVEKYDATSERQPHKVEAEYGNQGSGFKGVATEGFGWVNASYLIGLQNLDVLSKRALGMVTSPTDFFAKMNPSEKDKYGLR